METDEREALLWGSWIFKADFARDEAFDAGLAGDNSSMESSSSSESLTEYLGFLDGLVLF